MSTVDFKAVVESAGVPMSEDALIAKFRQIATEEGVVFNNTCSYSPFWRLVSIVIARPLLWLMQLLHLEILPALFLKTARDMDTEVWVDSFAWQLGLERKAETKARGEIILTRSNTIGTLLVPKGTVIQSAPISGKVYRLETIADYNFVAGNPELRVIAEAVEAGSAYNLAAGFYAVISTQLAGIVGIRNNANWLLVPGADRENNNDLADRCRNQFSAVNQWHIDAAYIAMVTKWAGVNVKDIYIEHDAPRGSGTANLYILFENGAPAQEYIAQMTNYIMNEGNHGFSDDLLIAEIPTQSLDQRATVVLDPTLDAARQAILKAKIEQFIRVALRDLPPTDYQPTRPHPNSRFAWSKLITELHQSFSGLVSIDFANDTDIQTKLWVPKLRNLEVVLV